MLGRLINKYRKHTLIAFLLILIFILVNQQSYDPKIDATTPIELLLASPALKASNATTTSGFKTQEAQINPSNRSFYVFSKNCKIPQPNIYAEEIMSMLRPELDIQCTKEPDLVSLRFNVTTRLYSLHINMEVGAQLKPNISQFACFYHEVFRAGNDSYSGTRGPRYFLQDESVPRHIQGLIVQCHELHKPLNVIQRDAFALVQFPASHEKPDRLRDTYPSIIILGIDSMSRMHFKRTMPETVKFVSQPGWYEMEGYNKVGDNTLPNLLALLTGRTPHQSLDICNVKKPGCFNQLVYLWNHFKNAGYLTAYAEDISSIDTFNYLKRGFDRQPVDFYLRPFMMTVELAMTTLKHFGYPFCIGRRLSFYYVYEFCEQMVKRFISETYRPIFGLFWTNSYTHESYTGATILDDKFAGFLRRFKKLGLFDHSIVILLSDHGYRYGPLVELKDGYLEERLPMLHIYLPPWYRAKYPKVSRALRENRNRLSSVYDLHLALKHVLIQLRPGIEFDRDVGCPKCRPLFKKLPRDRSCEDAGIKEHWCTCQPYAKVQPEFFMEYLAKMVVYRINKLMRMKQYENICYRLQYSRLDMAERKLHFDDGGNVIGAPQGVESYRLKFDTTAKAPQTSLKKLVAKFRVTIKCNRDHLNGVKIHLPFISRLDSYQSETSCVHERIAKKFCFCMDAGAANLAKNTSQELEDTSLFHEDEYD